MLNKGFRNRLMLANSTVVIVFICGLFLSQRLVFATSTAASTGWLSTASMHTPRQGHTATLLANGMVLVSGGRTNLDTNGIAATAEVYDPATSTWSTTGSMALARAFHTATRLMDGSVLVVGGSGNNGTSASAEIYHPTTRVWTSGGVLLTPRVFHTATLLPDGTVLVAGGTDGSGFLASAEVYNPGTNMWAATGSMTTEREYHTATLLSNGTVLIVGGNNGPLNDQYLASTELYDPASRSWHLTGSMTTAREAHAATLVPGGLVLVASGYNGIALASTETYDPSTGTWQTSGNMAVARYDHTLTLLPDGTVLAAGGYNINTSVLSSAEVYDSASGRWRATGSMSTAREFHTATLLPNGKVLVTGGDTNSSPPFVSSAELCTPANLTPPICSQTCAVFMPLIQK